MLNLTISVITRVVFAGQLGRRIKVSVRAAFEVMGWDETSNLITPPTHNKSMGSVCSETTKKHSIKKQPQIFRGISLLKKIRKAFKNVFLSCIKVLCSCCDLSQTINIDTVLFF